MRLLLVAATALEVAPLAGRLTPASPSSGALRAFAYASHQVDLLTTGVGMVATAAWCARVLAQQPYDLAVNLGVCGSFDPACPPGTVVHVVTDCLPELGAEDGDEFLTVHQLGLLKPDAPPFTGGRLVNATPPSNQVIAELRTVNGITVNTVHGHLTSIEKVVARFTPDVESMEGAAFMYACLQSGTCFAQVRAVSNVVEKRNRAAWKLAEAVDALNRVALRLIEHT
jgi:futalosine hydrolase